MPEREPPHNKLRKKIAGSIRDLLVQNAQFAQDAKEAFERDDFDPDEVSVVLQLGEGISQTVRTVFETGRTRVLFSRDHNAADQQETLLLESATVSTQNNGTEIEENGPKTFSELLTLKLYQRLPDQPKFTRRELEIFTPNIKGAKSIFNSYQGSTFSREDTLKILQQVLTTPREHLRRTEEFNRRTLLASFPSVKSTVLDKWSSEIGHDWTNKPNIDFQTAMQVRGLSMLEKLNLPSKTSA